MIVTLQVLGRTIRLDLPSRELRDLVLLNFGAMAVPETGGSPDMAYAVRVSNETFVVEVCDRGTVRATNQSDLIYILEKDITVELQRRRADLFFLHSGVVEWNGKAFLLPADSGSGKSTTTWALLHHGFGYLSDELAPIDLEHMQVLPYAHAICLKQHPRLPYVLPAAALDLGRTIHIPVRALPTPPVDAPRPIGGMLFLKYAPDRTTPLLTRLSRADAATRMYVAALNALAHADYGLAPVSRLVANVPCFEILTAGLPESCALIRSLAENPEIH